MSGHDALGVLLAAGLLSGAPMLLAALGEIFSERAGVLNLGIEGMMLASAMSGFAAASATGSAWIGLLAGIATGAALAAIHAFDVVICGGDQVVSGLALGFFATGVSSVLGGGLVGKAGPTLPEFASPALAQIAVIGRPLFQWNVVVPLSALLAVTAWALLERTRFGLLAKAAGEAPVAARSLGVSVPAQRIAGALIGGAMAGLAGASLSLGVTPGWVDNMTAGQGWIAIGLVVFSRGKPWRAALGAFLFGFLRRALLDLQGVEWLPLFKNPNLGYFLAMIPYLATILVLAAEGAARSRHTAEDR